MCYLLLIICCIIVVVGTECAKQYWLICKRAKKTINVNYDVQFKSYRTFFETTYSSESIAHTTNPWSNTIKNNSFVKSLEHMQKQKLELCNLGLQLITTMNEKEVEETLMYLEAIKEEVGQCDRIQQSILDLYYGHCL